MVRCKKAGVISPGVFFIDYERCDSHQQLESEEEEAQSTMTPTITLTSSYRFLIFMERIQGITVKQFLWSGPDEEGSLQVAQKVRACSVGESGG